MYYFVYMTTNKVNGKRYIGKHETKDLNDGYLGSGTILRRSIRKYGESAFERTILYEGNNRNDINEAEIRLIVEHNAINDQLFYNIATGGAGGDTYSGTTPEEQLRRNLLSGSKRKGKAKSDAHRKAISEAKMGKPRVWKSPEDLQRYRESRREVYASGKEVMPLGNTGNKDFRHKEETKKILSDSMKRRRLEAETQGRKYQSEEGISSMKQKINDHWTEQQREIHAETLRKAHALRKQKGFKRKIWIHDPNSSPINRAQIDFDVPIPEGWVLGQSRSHETK